MAELPTKYKYVPLADKKIVIGLTGSIAVYRTIDFVRKLIRLGAKVITVFTPKAMEFINPVLFEWATQQKPVRELSGKAEHILLSKEWDAMVIAPATLNTMSKIAYGIGDNPVTLTAIAFLGVGKPVLFVPSMNLSLYNSPQYRNIAEKLYDYGAIVLPPLISEGKAKYPPIDDLAYCVDTLIYRERDMAGFKVLVTAGPTREYIDPVRIITNPSSGLMGLYIAREIACRGGYVTLIHGPIKHDPPYLVDARPVETTIEMAEAVKKAGQQVVFDAAVFAAAPADYKPVRRASKKIPSKIGDIAVKFRPTVKVIKALRQRPKVVIAFAAETVNDLKELIEKGREKLKEYRADLVVANRVGLKGLGFASDYIEACLVTDEDAECLGIIHKAVLARKVVDWVANRLGESKD